MKHKLHSCNVERCFICDGGLALCQICGGGEASLPTDCPGYRMTYDRKDLIVNGQIDFINGKWQVLKPISELKK
jgi:hypothetical protein